MLCQVKVNRSSHTLALERMKQSNSGLNQNGLIRVNAQNPVIGSRSMWSQGKSQWGGLVASKNVWEIVIIIKSKTNEMTLGG